MTRLVVRNPHGVNFIHASCDILLLALSIIFLRKNYSHSIVAGAFGERSYNTLHTPLTSLKILSVTFFNTAQSISGTVALIASTVLTALMITGRSNTRLPSLTPVERKLGTTVKNCHTLSVSPAMSNSSLKIALIGRPNVGKSTLLNNLAKTDVYVKDELFATLDTTTRNVWLGDGKEVLFTDTVGFVNNLPQIL